MAKLLVLEDDIAFGFRLKRELIDAEHEVELYSAASDAIEELCQTQYDLLITDIIIRQDNRSVPDGGIKLVAWVRRNANMRTIPIIAMTGTHKFPGMKSILSTIEQVGANASLEKPFHMDDLLAMIDRLLVANPSGLHNAMHR